MYKHYISSPLVVWLWLLIISCILISTKVIKYYFILSASLYQYWSELRGQIYFYNFWIFDSAVVIDLEEDGICRSRSKRKSDILISDKFKLKKYFHNKLNFGSHCHLSGPGLLIYSLNLSVNLLLNALIW